MSADMDVDTYLDSDTGQLIDLGQPEADTDRPRQRRAWRPEQDSEAAALLRRLAATPWLVGGRDDEIIAAVRRLEPLLADTLSRLGWSLVVERDLVRLRKSPPPRPAAWAADGPSPLECSWFFLLVAAAESQPSRVAIGTLVTAARSAAAEAGLPSTNDIAERRAIVRALRMLDARGVVERLDGDVDAFLTDEQAPVLLAVRHTRLAHVVANPGTLNPTEDPHGWLEQVRREPDPARRMRRALVDDTCVHSALLDDMEANWLRRRGRGDDGLPLAQAFGLTLERRSEGAAFVVPDEAYRWAWELGPAAFPMPGTVAHAALLLVDHANIHGTHDASPGPGWRGMTAGQVETALGGFADEYSTGKGGWGTEYAEDLPKLAATVGKLLTGANLLMIAAPDQATGSEEGGPAGDGPDRDESYAEATLWWFAPITGRWAEEGSATPKATGRHRSAPARRQGRASASAKAGGSRSPGTPRPAGGTEAEADLFSSIAEEPGTPAGAGGNA